MMTEENDWIMRQINSFAQGLGYMLAQRKGDAPTEIIFPVKAAQNLPHQDELQHLINQQAYGAAAARLLKLRYAITEPKFMALSLWFYNTLNQYNDAQLQAGHYSKQAIITGLKQLEQLYD